MTRWKLTIEYEGSEYSGWQRQDNAPTVQEELHKALYQFCQQEVITFGASRTDSGVHALGQVCHFDLDYGDRELRGFDLMKALNAHLRPQPISVLHAEIVDDEFHARFSAHQKLYSYKIVNRSSFLATDRGRAWLVMPQLDIAAMREGAKHLLGRHDFSSFRDSECQAKSPIREIDRLDIADEELGHHRGMEIIFYVEGKAFLHHMVRNIVGTLVLVGKGKLTPDDVKTILEAKDRSKAGMTAPADGLTLVSIDY